MNQTTHSLSKDKINFVLLEGIHDRAAQVIERAAYGNLVQRRGALDDDALVEVIRDAHFLGIRSRTKLNDALLDRAPKLTAIGCFCIGTDQVQLDAARQRGIPVFNAPYANTRSVAELVLAEIIFLLRGISAKHMAAHRGEWLKTAVGSHEVRGKVLGIVGYGHFFLAEGLGMKVIYHDILDKLPLGNAEAMPSLTDVLEAADVLSLHVPDTDLTRHLIGATELKNCSRARI